MNDLSIHPVFESRQARSLTVLPLHVAVSILMIACLTGLLFLVGRARIGEAVIALVYLVPIVWCTARWGQVPGILSAIAAAAAFDFFFIPPFYTFTVGSLEGWLVLVIFLLVAIVIVGRIQSGLTRAQNNEREAIFMYELIAALSRQRSREAVARVLAEYLQQLFQATLVEVTVYKSSDTPAFVSRLPSNPTPEDRPDLIIPLCASQQVEGEIKVWKGQLPIPAEDNRLIQAYATQGAFAIERVRCYGSDPSKS